MSDKASRWGALRMVLRTNGLSTQEFLVDNIEEQFRALEAEVERLKKVGLIQLETVDRAERAEARLVEAETKAVMYEAFLIGHHAGKLLDVADCPNCRGWFSLSHSPPERESGTGPGPGSVEGASGSPSAAANFVRVTVVCPECDGGGRNVTYPEQPCPVCFGRGMSEAGQ